MPHECDDRPFQIDHIISKKHQGPSVAANLALSCFRCNSLKGSDISGRNRNASKPIPLFDPRRHKWNRHFRWEGARLIGLTPIGRFSSITLLHINDTIRVELREELIEEGVFPPI